MVTLASGQGDAAEPGHVRPERASLPFSRKIVTSLQRIDKMSECGLMRRASLKTALGKSVENEGDLRNRTLFATMPPIPTGQTMGGAGAKRGDEGFALRRRVVQGEIDFLRLFA
jgi:hypothetical protein